MSFLDSLKSAMLEDETPTTPEPTKVAQKVVSQSYVPTTPITTPVTGPAISPKRMKQTLLDELTKNISGSPYLQFQKINAQMKLKIADTSTRCIAIGASMMAQDVSKQSILDGAENAIKFLNNEANNFQNEVNLNLTNLQAQFQTKTAAIAAALEQKQNQIKALSDEISALQKDKSTLEVETEAQKTKLEVSRIEFTGSLDSIVQEINTDINDIKIYLGV